MKLAKLSPVLAEKICQLEAKLSSVKLGLEEIKKNLKEIEANNCNLSQVLLDKQNNLIGYVMAWLTDSQFIIDETIAFIDALAILPDYESYKYNLLKGIVKSLEEKKLQGTAIESSVLYNDLNLWTNDSKIEEEVGYILTNSLIYTDNELNQELALLRFEPVTT